MSTVNRNTFYAKTFVDELIRCGVEHVIIAPGSRSTPLVNAFASHQHIHIYSLLDERSASYFALGIGQKTGKPAVILCSSGTAGVNFHPAVTEARYANVPLIILTADRPHELRGSGANQTIDQVKMFGDHVLWAVDMALPEAHPPRIAIDNLRTTAARAVATANGVIKGPVHLNFPFRKPLEPLPADNDIDETLYTSRDDKQPFTTMFASQVVLSDAQIKALADIINRSQRGIIICGPRTQTDEFSTELAKFAEATGFPVFVDPLSSLRFSPELHTIGGYETFLNASALPDEPDIVIHFGAMPTSKALETYLNRIHPEQRILISHSGEWLDAYHLITHFAHTDTVDFCRRITPELNRSTNQSWSDSWSTLETTTWQAQLPLLAEELFDGSAIHTVIKNLPNNTHLILGNSLPVRHADQYGRPRNTKIHTFGNRGTSGIDGVVSTAAGIAATTQEPTVLIIGDISFYHDLNGLLAIKRANITNLTIVLINNDGGGIFHRLPIAQFDPPFTELFLTPHGLEFEPAIRMYGLSYTSADSLSALEKQLSEALSSMQSSVIEIRTNSKHDLERRKLIQQQVIQHLKNIQ